MRILVYGETISASMDKMEEILKQKKDEIHEINKTSYSIEAIMKDGTLYKTVVANDYARGYKWNYAYIDRNIRIGIFMDIILPSQHREGSFEYY